MTGEPPQANPRTTSSGQAGDACNQSIGAVKDALTDPRVTSIDATGACTIVTVHTSLADTDIDDAVTFCDAGAKVAYVGGTSSIAINAQSGKELATAVQGQPCIGEP